jgi:hypothetical protein
MFLVPFRFCSRFFPVFFSRFRSVSSRSCSLGFIPFYVLYFVSPCQCYYFGFSSASLNALMHIHDPSEVDDVDFTIIDGINPPVIGLHVASFGINAKVIGANLLAKYASEVGFTTTYHVSTTVDKQGRSRRVDITCIQGGKPRAT